MRVHRLASTQFGRGALLGRALDYVSFYRSVRQRIAELAGPGDIVVAKTDPPLLSALAMSPARRNGARLVNWLQDIYPETAEVLGVPGYVAPLPRVRRRFTQSLIAAGRGKQPSSSAKRWRNGSQGWARRRDASVSLPIGGQRRGHPPDRCR